MRRLTIDVASEGITGTEFSTQISSDQPIVVDRTMFGTADGIARKWGHAALGVTETATTWYLAEGAVHSSFVTFILLANPNSQEVQVQLRFLLANGTQVTKMETVGANSRKTINVEASYTEMVDQAGFSTEVNVQNSGPGIIVERAMYFVSGGFTQRSGATNVVGLTAPRTSWFLPEGAVGGSSAFETFILIGNPNSSASEVTVSFIKTDGTSVDVNMTVNAGQRVTVKANDYIDDTQGTVSISTSVESTNGVGVVTERAMYFTAGGVKRYEGHASGGIPVGN